jgi:hypothetical protein
MTAPDRGRHCCYWWRWRESNLAFSPMEMSSMRSQSVIYHHGYFLLSFVGVGYGRVHEVPVWVRRLSPVTEVRERPVSVDQARQWIGSSRPKAGAASVGFRACENRLDSGSRQAGVREAKSAPKRERGVTDPTLSCVKRLARTMADRRVHDRPIYAFTITDLGVHHGPTRALA